MKNLYETLREISLPDEFWLPLKQCNNIYYSISNKGRYSSGISINPKRHKGRAWKVRIISPLCKSLKTILKEEENDFKKLKERVY